MFIDVISETNNAILVFNKNNNGDNNKKRPDVFINTSKIF